jgi:hypothetical protein
METATQQAALGAAADGRLRGYIRDNNPVKGYCFIRTDDGLDFFCFYASTPIAKQMREKALAEFTPVTNTAPKKCPRAIDVVVLG